MVRKPYVRKMVKKVLAESKIKEPPVDLQQIIRSHGLGYEEVEDFPDSVDALTVQDGKQVYIAVNARHHIHRRRFSAAHELGHWFLHREEMHEDSITIDNPPSEGSEIGTKAPAESEADLFAGELLVPLEMLRVHHQKTIPELSKIFVVSEQVVSIAVTSHMGALYK